MSGLSVVIPSRDVRNLMPCARAVDAHEPDIHMIVIWDAPKTGDPSISDLWDVQNMLREIKPQGAGIVLRGQTPFIFARNCNIGINACDDDVILLNDDAILESPGGFTAMQEYAAQHPEFGLISATTNVAGNPAQHRRALTGVRTAGDCPGNSFPTVAFVCVLIPRRTIQAVGLLDERFGGVTPAGKKLYGYEDNDYCRRVRDAGLKLGIDDGCFVDHNRLHPTYRGKPEEIDMQAARDVYLEKWGSA